MKYRALFIQYRALSMKYVPDKLDRSLDSITLLLALNIGLFS